MLTNKHRHRSFFLALTVGILGIGFAIVAGFFAGAQPLYLGLALGAILVVVFFFAKFEQAVLGLLIVRSSLDVFSAQQIPAAFAIGLDVLTLLYVIVQLLTGKTIRTDRFWWFLLAWVLLQGLWVVLLAIGALGLDASFLLDSLREWVRLFTWVMVYLLVMQLQDRIPPQKVISSLFLALILPITLAFLQLFVPSLIPDFLSGGGDEFAAITSEGVSRVRGTLGLANTFATFLLLFMGLTWWKLGHCQQRWPWLILLGLLTFLLVSTKTLFSLMMLVTFIFVLIAPRFKFINFMVGLLLFVIVIGLFASSEFGQERLSSIAKTPLLNSDIDIWRAILLSQGDNNSFNWRIAQWNFLIQAWKQSPILGNGLATSSHLTSLHNMAHNDYVRALAEAGIVGIFTFLMFLITEATHIIQLLKSSPRSSIQWNLCLVLLGFFLATIVGMFTENIWSHTTLFFYWWTLLAVAGWNWNQIERSEKSVPIHDY